MTSTNNMDFSFLKTKYNYNRGICTKCAIAYWRINTSSGLCGQCDIAQKDYYFKHYTTQHIDVSALKQKYLAYFVDKGYKHIPERTLKVSRHNMHYLIAGICVYVPLYTNGCVIDAAPYYVNAQTCVRFKDYMLVGRTTRHFTNFVMLGQHVFENPSFVFAHDWVHTNFDLLFSFVRLFGEDLNLYTIHESEWTDNINKGKSLEIFIANLEICNQVYTTHDINNVELKYRYLDMGAGLARLWQIINKKESVYALYPSKDIILIDHIGTLLKMYESGIFCGKKNIGHTLKRLLLRSIKIYGFDKVHAYILSNPINTDEETISNALYSLNECRNV